MDCEELETKPASKRSLRSLFTKKTAEP